jgi:hypothetical protein
MRELLALDAPTPPRDVTLALATAALLLMPTPPADGGKAKEDEEEGVTCGPAANAPCFGLLVGPCDEVGGVPAPPSLPRSELGVGGALLLVPAAG